MRFIGTFEELKTRLRPLGSDADWSRPQETERMLRWDGGANLHWYPTTGRVRVDGRGSAELRALVVPLLADPAPISGRVGRRALVVVPILDGAALDVLLPTLQRLGHHPWVLRDEST